MSLLVLWLVGLWWPCISKVARQCMVYPRFRTLPWSELCKRSISDDITPQHLLVARLINLNYSCLLVLGLTSSLRGEGEGNLWMVDGFIGLWKIFHLDECWIILKQWSSREWVWSEQPSLVAGVFCHLDVAFGNSCSFSCLRRGGCSEREQRRLIGHFDRNRVLLYWRIRNNHHIFILVSDWLLLSCMDNMAYMAVYTNSAAYHNKACFCDVVLQPQLQPQTLWIDAAHVFGRWESLGWFWSLQIEWHINLNLVQV